MPRSRPYLAALVLSASLPLCAQPQRRSFGSSYDALRPPQKKLIDDFVLRFNRALGSRLQSADAYNSSRVSMRTTFDAVTHALLNTKLTGSGGEPLGATLDLVDAIEEVAGERPGERGDRQFRVYFIMKPGAIEKLDAAREFNREPDNTVFHKGYPICYRLTGGAPSIQISLSADALRADVDVDYRSSKIPASMFNGHLRSANSDVRAGNNADRHGNRWAGFTAWWKTLFGFDIESPEARPQEAAVRFLPSPA